MSLAERLRELRAKKTVSLQAVADAIGVSKPHVWELEKGKAKNPSLDLLKKIADFYGVTLDYLAGINEQGSSKLQYSALLRKVNPEDMSESDLKIIEQAIDFAVNIIKEKKQELDDKT